MKIISKYKDFYDYLQSVYGVDEKLILDRREGIAKDFPLINNSKNVLFICGKILEFAVINKICYFGEAIAPFNTSAKVPFYQLRKYNVDPVYSIEERGYRHSNFTHIYYPVLSEDIHGIYPELKNYKGCPIALYDFIHHKISIEFPSLLALGANKALSAEELWLSLSAWLGQRITEREPIVPVGDDLVRLKSAGFDPKTSFRNIK